MIACRAAWSRQLPNSSGCLRLILATTSCQVKWLKASLICAISSRCWKSCASTTVKWPMISVGTYSNQPRTLNCSSWTSHGTCFLGIRSGKLCESFSRIKTCKNLPCNTTVSARQTYQILPMQSKRTKVCYTLTLVRTWLEIRISNIYTRRFRIEAQKLARSTAVRTKSEALRLTKCLR